MLRQSLKIFLKSLPTSSMVQNALRKVEENDFHKRLRNELIMLPITLQDFVDEIIEKQAHVLESAISRVSLSHISNFLGYK